MGRTCVRGVGIVGLSSKEGHGVRKTKERTGREMAKVRASVWVMAMLVIAGLAAGCGQVSDRARQEAEKKVENKGQQAQEQAKEKLNAKKQEAKKKAEAGREDLEKKVNDLKQEVKGLRTAVTELQKKINAHEQKEQEQQINQLKKAVKDLKEKVEAHQRQGH
jgi:predicted RNase H-like nuclease (RuvC/YqgF family)